MGLHSCRPDIGAHADPCPLQKVPTVDTWSSELHNGAMEKGREMVAWCDESCFLLHMDGRVHVSRLPEKHGKKASQRRQSDAMHNVLFGNLKSCHPCVPPT